MGQVFILLVSMQKFWKSLLSKVQAEKWSLDKAIDFYTFSSKYDAVGDFLVGLFLINILICVIYSYLSVETMIL